MENVAIRRYGSQNANELKKGTDNYMLTELEIGVEM